MAQAIIPVRIRKQGGKWTTGEAVGRMGTELLVQYQIEDGQQRERWFKKARWDAGDRRPDLERLPRWRRATCKARALTNTEIADWFAAYEGTLRGGFQCEACGLEHHTKDYTRLDTRTGETFHDPRCGLIPEAIRSARRECEEEVAKLVGPKEEVYPQRGQPGVKGFGDFDRVASGRNRARLVEVERRVAKVVPIVGLTIRSTVQIVPA